MKKILFLFVLSLVFTLNACAEDFFAKPIEPAEKLIYHTVFVDGEKQLVIDGEQAVMPNPSREGFVLEDWLSNGKSYDWNSPVISDLEIESIWKEVKEEVKEPISMIFEVGEAKANISAHYSSEGINFNVEVLDKDVFTESSDIGLNDNIEINVQSVPTLKYDANYTLNFLCNAKGEHWIRKAKSPTAFGDNGDYATFAVRGVNYDYTFELTDNGYQVKIFFAWSILNTTYHEGFGNIRFIASMRDKDAWNYYLDNSCVWGRPYTYLQVNRNNELVLQNNQPLDVNAAFEYSALYDGKALTDNLAVVSGEGASLTAKLETGALLFADRRYGLNPNAVCEDLLGKTYLFDKINGSYGKVLEAGYIIMLVPNQNYQSLVDQIKYDGFEKIGGDTLVIASSVVNGGLEEAMDYYVKWCEVGEIIQYQKYNIVISQDQDSVEYTKDWLEDEATFNTDFTNHLLIDRNWHCIPTVAATKGGRIYASYETGGNNEPQDANYLVVACSDDNGITWKELWWIYNHHESASVNDSQLWVDPSGRLWITYQQRNAGGGFDKFVGCWAAVIDNPDMSIDKLLALKIKPRRLFDGFLKNDIVVLSDGTWLAAPNDFMDENNTIVYASTDQGETWEVRGGAYVPIATDFDETVIVELEDGRLWMTMRNNSGKIVQVFSEDKGYTWSHASQTDIIHNTTRFQIKRLPSGKLLLINNAGPGRANLTAYLSLDDGATWTYKMLIDSATTSYPDVAINSNTEEIYVIYDQYRHDKGNIHMAVFTEEYLMNHSAIEQERIMHVSCTYRESDVDVDGTYLGDSVWFEKSNGWNLEGDHGDNPKAVQMGAGTQYISFKNGLVKDFYVETKIHAHSIVDRDGYPKMGIVLRTASDKQIFYYINGESWFSGTKAWHVGYVENYKWGSEVEVPVSIDYQNDYAILGLLREGNNYCFYVNGVCVMDGFSLAGIDVDELVEVQFVTFNTRVTYKDYFLSVEAEVIADIKEKLSNVTIDTLFIGDSFVSLKYWTTFFDEMTGVNLGVGGSEVDYWKEKVNYLTRYNPEKIVMHIGVNDIDRGGSGNAVANEVIDLFNAIHKALPSTQILYISINPSQNYWHRHEEIDKANNLISNHIKETDYVTYLDFAQYLYTEDHNYVKTSLEADGLHLNSKGYALWNDKIKETLLSMEGAE